MSPETIVPSIKSYLKSTETKWARMGSWLLALLTFNLSLLTIQSCGLDIEDPSPPSPPVWVQKSLPEEWPERGIDAHESGGIYLEWEPNPENNIEAYLIYRAEFFDEIDSLGDYSLLSILEWEPNTPLEYVDSEIVTRVKYFYKLKAEDSANNKSIHSNSLAYMLLEQISFNYMMPNGQSESLDTERQLKWYSSYNLEMEDYTLTLLSHDNNFLHREILVPSNYTNGIESWIIPSAISLDHNQIYKWRIDTGAKYSNLFETAGSESAWANFLYIMP
jgi:hypothetical protein